MPEWSRKPEAKVDSREKETVCEVNTEAAKDGESTYMRRKLKLRSTTTNPRMPLACAAVSKAKLGLFIPSIVIPMIKGNKPVWIIIERSFEGVPMPWQCNLLSGGSRICPQRGGVHIIGDCFIHQYELLTEKMHIDNFDKHLQAEYIPGSFYVSLEKIVLYEKPISCSGCPPNGRQKKIIDMRSFQIDLKGFSSKEKNRTRMAKTRRGRPAKQQTPESPSTYLKKAEMKLLPPGKRVRGSYRKNRKVKEEDKRR